MTTSAVDMASLHPTAWALLEPLGLLEFDTWHYFHLSIRIRQMVRITTPRKNPSPINRISLMDLRKVECLQYRRGGGRNELALPLVTGSPILTPHPYPR